MSGDDLTPAVLEAEFGPEALEYLDRVVADAPPLNAELRERIRSTFASARAMRPTAAAADAA
ncbi:hypothetical protein [Streptomyces dubilierae]|uniref:Anti-sigma factor n=1 Tax=Streptomyces dubilierae TaxID=3075533 RepID=A0ABU2P6W4_9ACTN|nr:hypothetical protein [Streptomyces sp. DSM 41921]MDT0387880.1 hypothetical protein [Streptomyces sp. DSM 41921]